MSELEARWYVVHTYSGHEKKVLANLKKIVENRGMEDLIQEVVVPEETYVTYKEDKKTGGQKAVEKKRKLFPSYVIVKFVKTPETWFVVRNVKGVTGFVGGSTEPLPLTQEEAENMGLEKRTVHTNYSVGDSVRILTGSFADFVGVVEEVNPDKEKEQVKVMLEMFGRETSIYFDFENVARA